MDILKIKITNLGNEKLGKIIVTHKKVIFPKKYGRDLEGLRQSLQSCRILNCFCYGDSDIKISCLCKSLISVIIIDSLLLNALFNELKISRIYRKHFINKYKSLLKLYRGNNKTVLDNTLKFKLKSPEKEVLDYKWNERVIYMTLERRELEYTMSWLSTLGGAFSALGDHFENCAEIAGKISLHQFKLALRIGDPLTVARCKLFLSLSLIQRGYYKIAKQIILEQYYLGKNLTVVDTRLIRMCQGIWAKFKYERLIFKQGKMLKKTKNTNIKIVK